MHFPTRVKVALSGYLDRPDKGEWVARLRDLNPAMTIVGFRELGRFLSPGTMGVWVEGFRRAGLPER